MQDKRDLSLITLWELALYISSKLNKIGKYCIDYIHIEPEDILKKNPSRDELIFFFIRLCREEN